MTAKVLVIGVDALDSIQVQKYLAFLPNLKKIKESSPQIKLNSVHPPDSDTAWATIQTGLNPAQHGVVKYDDPLEKTSRLTYGEFNNKAIQGKTFWDYASRAGKKVCILFPHLGYPVWPVNGVMIGRPGKDETPGVYPPDFSSSYDLSKLNVVKGIPSRNKDAYIKANEVLVNNQTEFGCDLIQRDEWDLFYIYSSVLDMIQHYFWNLCDEIDPSYPGPNKHQNVIRHFYELHDRMIRKLIDLAGVEATTIVLSDHGHGMRPVKIFNINEMLRKNNWLVQKENPAQRQAASILDQSKNIFLKTISELGLGDVASKAIRFVPWARKLYSSPLSIDWNRTQAYATNLSGLKAYTYGGIVIHRNNLLPGEYGAIREKIISQMIHVVEPVTLTPIYRWIRSRGEIYEGPYLDRYPDILFELQGDFGAGLTVDGSLFGRSPSHHLVPGSHKSDTAVFLISNNKPVFFKSELQLMDVAGIITNLLNI